MALLSLLSGHIATGHGEVNNDNDDDDKEEKEENTVHHYTHIS